MPRACPVELSRSPRYKDPRRKQTDATGLSRGVVTLASLQRSKEKTNGCHGLVPWSCHARLATKIQGENKRMPRACPVELSRSPRYKDPRRKQTDATGLSRGGSRSWLISNKREAPRD